VAGAMPQERRLTRHAQRKQDEINPTNQEFYDTNPEVKELEKRHQETTKVRNIEKIVFGEYEINTWYFSPYPEEYGQASLLYICEFCLKYMRKHKTILHHKEAKRCKHSRPPGKLIY
jgi:histone acetyltransferase MYST1